MNKKKTHPDQLWLDFNQAVTEFRGASDRLADAAQALCHAYPGKESKKAVQEAEAEVAHMRRKLNEIVRAHARHKNLHWREVWRLLYERLRDKTGYDAIVKGLSRDIAPLEAVVRSGRLPKLLKIAEAL